MRSRIITVMAIFFLCGMAGFLGGMWTTYRNWAPWELTQEAQKAWRAWRATGHVLPENSYMRRSAHAAATAYDVARPDRIAPGLLAITRFSSERWTYVTDLIDAEGKILFTWPIDYSLIVAGGDPASFVHASHALPDGSLLVSFDEGHAIARLDACGKPIWARTDMVFHHSISMGANGFWTWGEPNWDGGQNQFLMQLNVETGADIQKISIIDAVVGASTASATTLGFPEGFVFTRDARENQIPDILHPNDIEELSPAMAAAFPQFSAGDLLISLRNLNLVAVLDHQTHAILWAQNGPWREQHDPDFQPDGTISVFSNNPERFRSTLISIDPKTNAARDLLMGSEARFDSFIMGRHQRLPNGNWLIASPMEGRALEVTSKGEKVREINNVLSDRYNLILSNVQALPESYFSEFPSCPQ